MKSPIWPIIKREYLSRFLTKGFWISTILVPLLIAGFTVLPSILAERTKSSPEPIKVVDTLGDFYPVFESTMAQQEGVEDEPPVLKEELAGRSVAEARRQLNAQAEEGTIQGYVVIEPSVLEESAVVYYARNPGSLLGGDTFRSVLRESVVRYRLQRLGVAGEGVEAATERVSFDVRKATNKPGQQDESGIAGFFMSFALVFFIYFTLIVYGIYILRGVLEEKSNRIVEIIVSSVKPFHLMMGKIIGIGAVGLTQITIWIVSALVLTAPQLAAVLSISGENLPRLSPVVLAFFPVYFILGYFLFATVYAGIGSMFNSDEDAQQMMGFANMLLIIPMLLIMPVMKNPAGPLATGLSLFPFFSPTLMYLRIGVQMPPAWQIALSVVIMLLTIVVMIWLVSKIYRVGILMYGKKPTIPEIVRWLRYT